VEHLSRTGPLTGVARHGPKPRPRTVCKAASPDSSRSLSIVTEPDHRLADDSHVSRDHDPDQYLDTHNPGEQGAVDEGTFCCSLKQIQIMRISLKSNSIRPKHKASHTNVAGAYTNFVNPFSIGDHTRSEAGGVKKNTHSETTDETSDGNSHDPTVYFS